MTYVRKKPKGYGRNARIEGAMSEGQRVLLVEDLTTDGGSKLSFVDAIRETGATCAHTAVIFYYGIFPETTQRLADHGVALHHLCTWWDVLAEARAQGAFDAKTLAEVERFLDDPRAWQAARERQFRQIRVFAAPPFLSLLRRHCGRATQRYLGGMFNVDLSGVDTAVLAQRIAREVMQRRPVQVPAAPRRPEPRPRGTSI